MSHLCPCSGSPGGSRMITVCVIPQHATICVGGLGHTVIPPPGCLPHTEWLSSRAWAAITETWTAAESQTLWITRITYRVLACYQALQAMVNTRLLVVIRKHVWFYCGRKFGVSLQFKEEETKPVCTSGAETSLPLTETLRGREQRRHPNPEPMTTEGTLVQTRGAGGDVVRPKQDSQWSRWLVDWWRNKETMFSNHMILF